MPVYPEVAKSNGYEPEASNGLPGKSRVRVAANSSWHPVINSNDTKIFPSTVNAGAQATTTTSDTPYTAGNEMDYTHAGCGKTVNKSSYVTFTEDLMNDHSTPPSGCLPVPPTMANAFNPSTAANHRGRDGRVRTATGSSVFYGGINANATNRGSILPSHYNTQDSFSPWNVPNWSSSGDNSSHGFELPNLNQSPGSENDVGYNRADYVKGEAPMSNNSGFVGHFANNLDSSTVCQVPTVKVELTHPTEDPPCNQQTVANSYSPELYNQISSGYEAPGADAIIEPYFPAYAFEAPFGDEGPETEEITEYKPKARQQHEQHRLAIENRIAQQQSEEGQLQQVLDQCLLLLPQHAEEEATPVSAIQGLPGVDQTAGLSAQQLHTAVPLPETHYVLDQEIVFPNVEDAAAAIASVADLLDGGPIDGPAWDWFDSQPFSSPVERNPLYGCWSAIDPLEPFIVPVQPQEATRSSQPQDQQATPAVPYLAEPSIEEIIDQVNFDWQLPTTEADFNVADYNPAHPFRRRTGRRTGAAITWQ